MAAAIVSWLWILLIAVWVVTALIHRQSFGGTATWGWRSWVLRLALLASALLVLKSQGPQAFDVNAANSLDAWTGVTLTAAGAATAIWARLTLGQSWGMPMTKQRQPQLVTGGPYRWVRHPIYTGFLLAILGTSVMLSYWLLIPFGLIAVYFVYAAKEEERYLLHELGDKYARYRKRTSLLVPLIF